MTTYQNRNRLDKDVGIKFITLKRRVKKIVENISLNALSSPIVVKVDFDIAMTLVANTFYKILAGQFKLFENAKPKKIYRNIVGGTAKIYFGSNTVEVVFGKKSFNPLIMDWINSLSEFKIPWMNNRLLQYDFE